MAKKQFKDLTKQGQNARLKKYEKIREENGTEQVLARVVKTADVKEIKDGAKLAVMRFVSYDKETEKETFFTATKYIAKGKDTLQNFYESLVKGQLVSVEYKEQNGFRNIWTLMDRSASDNRNKKKSAEAADELPA